MKRALVLLATSLILTVATADAKAHWFKTGRTLASKSEASYWQKQQHHASTTLLFLKNHPQAGTSHSRAIVRRNHTWLLKVANRHLVPTDWRTYLFSLVGHQTFYGCALPLIGRESGGVVTKWNYAGSGAYGLGQALPASKMAPYGADYMTNGVTQIKWMHVYVNRYGGWCAANAYQSRNGYY